METRWAKDVSPDKPLPEYPRPQMVRKDWQNLNGLWDYAVGAKEQTNASTKFDGKILVPFPIESALSVVMRMVSETNRIWYRRTFTIPRGWKEKKVLLHFGAVDWESTVYVNGKKIGTHQGGYDAFSFDITDALNRKGENEIVVSVWDPTDAGPQSLGKQIRNPHGIWYTPTSGWQTVWLEPVDALHFTSFKFTSDIDTKLPGMHDGAILHVHVDLPRVETPLKVRFEVFDGNRRITKNTFIFRNGDFAIDIPHAKLWSPESPHLYRCKLTLLNGSKKVDEIKSYFAMRKIFLARDDNGRLRMQLNNTNYFQFCLLD